MGLSTYELEINKNENLRTIYVYISVFSVFKSQYLNNNIITALGISFFDIILFIDSTVQRLPRDCFNSQTKEYPLEVLHSY